MARVCKQCGEAVEAAAVVVSVELFTKLKVFSVRNTVRELSFLLRGVSEQLLKKLIYNKL